MTGPFDRPPFGKEPEQPGGIDWEIDKAEKRIAFLDACVATVKAELRAAEADLAALKVAKVNAQRESKAS